MRFLSSCILLSALACSNAAAEGDTSPAPGTGGPSGGESSPPSSSEPSSAPPAAPGTITVGVASPQTRVVQGSATKLVVDVARGAGLEGADVAVKVSGLSAGLVASAVTIPAGKSRGEIDLAATGEATQGASEATVEALAGAVAASPVKATLFVRGAPGALDTTWGNGGLASFATSFGMYCRPSALHPSPDGRVAVLGYGRDSADRLRACAVRLDTKGTLDPSFVNDHVGPPNGSGAAHATARLGDGRFLVLMEGVAFRLTADGRQDATYGTNGVVSMPSGAPVAAVTSPGGAVVSLHGLANGYRATRFTAEGAVDTTFGSGGSTTVVTTTAPSSAPGLLVGADGHVAGVTMLTTNGFPNGVVAFFRLSAAGALDGSLGPNGVRSVSVAISDPAPTYSLARGLVERPDGGLVASATISGASSTTSRFVGVTKAGQPETSLGATGSSNAVAKRRWLLTPSGSDFVAAEGALPDDLALAKWTTSAASVASFASSPTPAFRTPLDLVRSDERLWALGTSTTTAPASVGVARYWD